MESSQRSRELSSWIDPEIAYLTLFATSRRAFWLDSGVHATTGFSYMGDANELLTASVIDGTVTRFTGTDDDSGTVTAHATIFDALRAELETGTASAPGPVGTGTAAGRESAALRESGPAGGSGSATDTSSTGLPVAGLAAGQDVDTGGEPHRRIDGAAGLSGIPAGEFAPGWVGWIGYEAGASANGTPTHPSRYPDAALLNPARLLIFDHASRTITAVERFNPADPANPPAPFEWLAGLSAAAPAPPLPVPEPHVARWRHSAPAYAALIAEAQAEIRRGNAYQLCLTNEVLVDGAFDPIDVYRRLRHASPSHHGGLVVVDGTALVSSSPEQFLRVAPDGTVTTRPIKGTRPRGITREDDVRLESELLGSDKERAENLMIVDLMRNDLGRVAITGSVAVTQLLAVESYAQVHQLVSTVTARLADGVSAVDAVESAFPAGSMTGAPKISAMTILDRLEAGPRGVYSGAFGYLGADGAVDLAMVIRSILIDARGASVGTGGGITALSVIDEEIEETRVKAAALLAALGASEQEVG